ncbi:hypothetical protein LguiB_006411 [Lonicera macranthoides]
MANVEFIFIASPLLGHIMQSIEMAKVMVQSDEDQKLYITFLLMKLPFDPADPNLVDSLAAAASSATHGRLRFLHLHLPPTSEISEFSSTNRGVFMNQLLEYRKPQVKDVVTQLMFTLPSNRLGGFFVDTLCTTMIDVADEFEVPTYVYFTSGAAFLGLILHFQNLRDEHHRNHITDLIKSNTDLVTPAFVIPVPLTVLPTPIMDREIWNTRFLHYARGYRKAKGIVVNTFMELESHALKSFSTKNNTSLYGKAEIPPIYAVGPILNRAQHSEEKSESIMKWLDDQPPSSVVFVCFGSMGSFGMEQVREIAQGLELAGYRFIWALRRPPPVDKPMDFPSEYTTHDEVLPEGFLDRTAKIGKVVGWAPQFTVLSHVAIGGFLSHCGWNSILESLWCGVPITTWPLFAEQQLNAFQLVREMGLATEITLDYNALKDDKVEKIVSAREIEVGITRMMDGTNEVRKKVAAMREKSKLTVSEGGSSYTSLKILVHDVMNNTR